MTESIFYETLIYTTLSLALLIYTVKSAIEMKQHSGIRVFIIGQLSVITWIVFSLSLTFATLPEHSLFCAAVIKLSWVAAMGACLYTCIIQKNIKWLVVLVLFAMTGASSNSTLDLILMSLGAGLWLVFERHQRLNEQKKITVEQLMDLVDDEIIVLDCDENIMAVSGTLKKMALNQRIPDTFSELLKLINWQEDENGDGSEGFITLDHQVYRILISRQNLENERHEMIGEVVVCHDISDFYRLKTIRDTESQKLAQAHRELVDYITVQNELAVEETKRQFTEKIEQSIGMDLAALTRKIEEMQARDHQGNRISSSEIEPVIEAGRLIIQDIRTTATLLMAEERHCAEGDLSNHDQNNCGR